MQCSKLIFKTPSNPSHYAMAPNSSSPRKSAQNASLVEINVEAVALCPYALDDVRAEAPVNDSVQIGVGIAGFVARDFSANGAIFKRGDEVWSRVPVSLHPAVQRVQLDAKKVINRKNQYFVHLKSIFTIENAPYAVALIH